VDYNSKLVTEAFFSTADYWCHLSLKSTQRADVGSTVPQSIFLLRVSEAGQNCVYRVVRNAKMTHKRYKTETSTSTFVKAQTLKD
jgi:hypothetical protein